MDNITVRGIVEAFVVRCEVELLLIETDAAFVGSDNVDRVQLKTDIAHGIAAFKLEYNVRGGNIKITSNDLY